MKINLPVLLITSVKKIIAIEKIFAILQEFPRSRPPRKTGPGSGQLVTSLRELVFQICTYFRSKGSVVIPEMMSRAIPTHSPLFLGREPKRGEFYEL